MTQLSLASSGEQLTEKLKYLEECCDEYGIHVKEDKTKLVIILGSEENRQPIQLTHIIQLTHL